MWENIGYALLCVIVPVAWGLVIYKASNWIAGRLSRGLEKAEDAPQEPPPPDYYI